MWKCRALGRRCPNEAGTGAAPGATAGLGLVETGTPVVPYQGIWSEGRLEQAGYAIDKRGVLTPTLIALASLPFGYSADVAFGLSLLLGWLALGAYYLALRCFVSRSAA